MIDLDPQEREAMEAAMRSGSEHGTLGESTWRAAREYSKQREEELREALEKIAIAAQEMTNTWPGAISEIFELIERHARAALAENGDSDA